MNDAARYVELLSRNRGLSALEGAGLSGIPDRAELIDRLQAEIAYVERKTGEPADPGLVQTLVSQADAGLRRLFDDGAVAVLGPGEVSGLEAVIRTDGSRPVLFVEDDFIDVTAPSIGGYAAALSLLEASVRAVCRSVGRVDDPTASLGYQGTAWMVGDGLVATAFHVLEAIAPGGRRRGGRFEGRLNVGASVHFGHEVGSRRDGRRFPIRRVVSVGPEGAATFARPDGLNFDDLDLAILELEPVAGRPFPEPLKVARASDPATPGRLASAGRGVYLVGYPGDRTTTDLFIRIFAGLRGFKRLAPGRIMVAPGGLPSQEDPRRWILTHDASTLGGNSGSALIDLDGDGRTVLGLHFAGQDTRRNWAHGMQRVTAELPGLLAPPVL
jgi:hypothetical protein